FEGGGEEAGQADALALLFRGGELLEPGEHLRGEAGKGSEIGVELAEAGGAAGAGGGAGRELQRWAGARGERQQGGRLHVLGERGPFGPALHLLDGGLEALRALSVARGVK